jgi:hypothetical protein
LVMILKDPVKFNNEMVSWVKLANLNVIKDIRIDIRIDTN